MDPKQFNRRLDKLESLINELKESASKRYDDLEKQICEVIKSQSFINTQYEEIKKSLNAIETVKKDLVAENKCLKAEVLKSTNEINMLKETLNDLEQYSRRECLEIRGIPEPAEGVTEQTNAIIQKLGKKIGVVIKENEISVSHRLPNRTRPKHSNSPNTPPTVIVKFVRREVRDKFYHAKKNLRNITTQDLGYETSNKIFLAESLTQRNKTLFNRCLQAKRELGFKFIWTNMGRIFMRKDEESHSPVHRISSSNDLEKLK